MTDNASFPLPESASGERDETTDFGYRSVPRAEKKPLVRAVFDSVAGRYDVMNDVMSLGIHRVWKRIFITTLVPRRDLKLLDLAGGTGDISFGWLKNNGGPALLTDINASMLEVGRSRAASKGYLSDIEFSVVDAEAIPLPDRSVDRVSIAFGLRNCTDKDAVLREARRVLRPGGKFCCLEFSRVQVAALAPIYDAWSFGVLPEWARSLQRMPRAIAILRKASALSPSRMCWPR